MYGNPCRAGLIQPYCLLAALLLSTLLNPAIAQDRPALQGRELYQVACSGCHGLRVIAVTRNGRSGWEDTVHKMVLAGTQLNVEEMEIVTDYLTSRFGPGTTTMKTGLLPPGSPLQTGGTVSSEAIVLPENVGKELVQTLCTSCHDLGRVVSNRKSRENWQRYTEDMLARGNIKASVDQIQGVVAYLDRYFGLAR